MKKGFTLIELIATLVILAVIAVIVTTNISKSLKGASKTLYEVQLNTYQSAAEQWISYETDISINDVITNTMPLYELSNINSNILSFNVIDETITETSKELTGLEDENIGYSYIFLPVIVQEGLVDDNIVSRDTKEEFSDLTFIAIKQSTVDETIDANSNYKYKYTVVDTDEKMFTYFANLYFELYPDSTKTYLVINDILTLMPNDLLRMSGETILGIISLDDSSTINTITISINTDGTYLIS